jgi:hypothetical protein
MKNFAKSKKLKIEKKSSQNLYKSSIFLNFKRKITKNQAIFVNYKNRI